MQPRHKMLLAMQIYNILDGYEHGGTVEIYHRLNEFISRHQLVCNDSRACMVPQVCRDTVSQWLGERHFGLPSRDNT